MSLINDALKRARQAQQENPAPAPDLQFRPAESAPPRSGGLPILPIALIMIALFLSGGFIFLALQKRAAANSTVAQAAPLAAQNVPEAAVAPVAPPVVASANSASTLATISDVSPSAPVNPVSTNTAESLAQLGAESSAATNAVETIVAVEPPKPEVPRLQGIAFNPSRPSAVVNGKTVYVGGRVGDFRVIAITVDSVTVVSATQTNVLSLSE